MIKKPYTKVTIELKEDFKLNEIKNLLSSTGETEINIIIKTKIKKLTILLKKIENLTYIILKL